MSHADKLEQALKWALEWIDAVPKDAALPTMPGFDRDYVDGLLSRATPTGELETVAWAVTCNGDITRNIYTSLSEAESCLLSLNTTHPKDKREIEPLVRKSDALAHSEAVRGASQALIDRWDVPLTGMSDVTPDEAIERLRAALLASQGEIVREDKK